MQYYPDYHQTLEIHLCKSEWTVGPEQSRYASGPNLKDGFLRCQLRISEIHYRQPLYFLKKVMNAKYMLLGFPKSL